MAVDDRSVVVTMPGSTATSLAPDTWRIDDTSAGWRLRYRPPLSGLSRHLPWLRWIWMRDWPTSAFVVAMAGLVLVIVALILDAVLVRPPGSTPPTRLWQVVLGVVSTILSMSWYLVTWPVLAEAEENAERVVEVRDGRVHLWQGVFPSSCLRSLCAARGRSDGFRAWRTNLVFRGTVVPEAVFADDMSERVAGEILAAVRARIGDDGGDGVGLMVPRNDPERSSR